MDLINEMKAVRNIFIERPKYFDFLNKQLAKVDKEIQDLLHVIELGKLDAVALMKVSRDLKKARIERRYIKNDLDMLTIVNEFVDSSKGKTVKQFEIEQSIGKLRSMEQRIERRVYRMRIRNDLQHFVD